MSIYFRNLIKSGVEITAKEASIVKCGKEFGQAKQEMKDETDINVILRNLHPEGVLKTLTDKVPQFASVDVFDLKESMNVMIQAENAFNALPAKLRKELDHSAINFLAAIQDEGSRELFEKYGLLKPVEVEKPVLVNVVNSVNDDQTTK